MKQALEMPAEYQGLCSSDELSQSPVCKVPCDGMLHHSTHDELFIGAYIHIRTLYNFAVPPLIRL